MKTKILNFFLISLLLYGCVKEDRSDCLEPEPEPSVFTYFSYKGDGIEEIFQQKIENVSVFIFDEKEMYVDKIDLTHEDLQTLQGVYLSLPEGTYELVCWGNIFTKTNVEENDQKVDCHLNHPVDIDDLDIESSDPLYYGRKVIEIAHENVTDTVHFESAHIKMNLTVINSGMNVTTPANSRLLLNENMRFKVEIGNLSESVDFYLNYSTEKMSYYPSLSFMQGEEDEITAAFNVLRFQDNNDVYIRLWNADTNEQILNMALREFMEKFNIKVTGINEVEVSVVFIFNGTTVSIQNWDEEDLKPGMQ